MSMEVCSSAWVVCKAIGLSEVTSRPCVAREENSTQGRTLEHNCIFKLSSDENIDKKKLRKQREEEGDATAAVEMKE